MSARVTPDGQSLAFNSLRELTGFDNVVQATGERDNEIFLYDAASKTLSCASCYGTPTVEQIPLEEARIQSPMRKEQWAQGQGYVTHQLANDGAIFFDAKESLLPADENGKVDVYQYRDGQLSLISSGTSSDDSYFREATPSGSDVYLISTQALVGSDTDNRMSLYDARVDGGFAEPPPPTICEEEKTCRGTPPEPPLSSAPASAIFSGPGNPIFPPPPPSSPPPRHCKRGFHKVRVHGHSVCKRVRKHHKHRHASHRPRRG